MYVCVCIYVCVCVHAHVFLEEFVLSGLLSVLGFAFHFPINLSLSNVKRKCFSPIAEVMHKPNRPILVLTNFLSLILLSFEKRVVEIACNHVRTTVCCWADV